jgi:transposase
LTHGQAHDLPQGRPLVEGLNPEAVIADKAYDAHDFLEFLSQKEILIVIPHKKNRKEKRNCDFFRYKERHLVECCFNKIKHFRRVFSRFDKLATKYLAFLQFVSTLIWLR